MAEPNNTQQQEPQQQEPQQQQAQQAPTIDYTKIQQMLEGTIHDAEQAQERIVGSDNIEYAGEENPVGHLHILEAGMIHEDQAGFLFADLFKTFCFKNNDFVFAFLEEGCREICRPLGADLPMS